MGSRLRNDPALDYVRRLAHPCLHAQSICFAHPPAPGGVLNVEAPEPQRFTELLALLRQHRSQDAAVEDSTGTDGVQGSTVADGVQGSTGADEVQGSTNADNVQDSTGADMVQSLTNATAVEDLTNADEATVKQDDEAESVAG